jgi:hypothetical protein
VISIRHWSNLPMPLLTKNPQLWNVSVTSASSYVKWSLAATFHENSGKALPWSRRPRMTIR